MSGVVDTNLLLYAANSKAAENARAVEFLTRAAGSNRIWHLTEGILYEFLRVATHPKVFDRPLAWNEGLRFLKPILGHSQFRILSAGSRHWDMLETVLGDLTRPSGNLFFDVRTVVLMREHGVRRIYTTDADLLQFSDIEVVNPLRASPGNARL